MTTAMRWLNILRHPIHWAFGNCFICGQPMFFDDRRFMGNHHGFCWDHGEAGSYGRLPRFVR